MKTSTLNTFQIHSTAMMQVSPRQPTRPFELRLTWVSKKRNLNKAERSALRFIWLNKQRGDYDIHLIDAMHDMMLLTDARARKEWFLDKGLDVNERYFVVNRHWTAYQPMESFLRGHAFKSRWLRNRLKLEAELEEKWAADQRNKRHKKKKRKYKTRSGDNAPNKRRKEGKEKWSPSWSPPKTSNVPFRGSWAWKRMINRWNEVYGPDPRILAPLRTFFVSKSMRIPTIHTHIQEQKEEGSSLAQEEDHAMDYLAFLIEYWTQLHQSTNDPSIAPIIASIQIDEKHTTK